MLLTVTMNAAIDKRYVVENGQQGKVNRVKECAYTPGGKGINVSKQARIAGVDVLATGVVGGYAGKYIENKLAEMGIDTSFYHVEGESRSCINIWDERSKIQTEYLEPGIQVTPKETSEFLALFDQLTDLVDLIEISGSVPRGMDERLYPKMIGMCRKKGKRVILDTSGTLLFEGIKAHPTLIKPNADEIAMLTGENPDDIHAVADSARRIQNGGVDYVVVSLGADGAVMACGEGVYRAQVPRVAAVNTVGCGDAMIAGFSCAMLKKMTPPEMLRFASAVSAASAMTEQTGYFGKEDLERLYGLHNINCKGVIYRHKKGG